MLRKLLFLSVILIPVAAVSADRVQEEYPDGKLKLDYYTNDEGQKHGPYNEFFPSGKRRIQKASKKQIFRCWMRYLVKISYKILRPLFPIAIA